MNNLRQLGTGLLGALASLILVFSALSLSAVEGMSITTPTAQPSPTQAVLQPGESTFTPVAATSTSTNTPLPPTSCPPPRNWKPYTIQTGDTLESLAATSGISVDALSQANCLLSSTLLPGTILYLPPAPTNTRAPAPAQSATDTAAPTARPCGPPPGWVLYTVKPGDTLYRLSVVLGVSVGQLQMANCLSSPNLIQAGSVIYVPFLPKASSTPTATQRPKQPTATKTAVPPSPTTAVPPSATPTTPNTPTPETPTPVTVTPVTPIVIP